MKHILSFIFILTLFTVNSSVFAKLAVANQLITELKVFGNDTTFRYVFLYNEAGKKTLETKYFVQGNLWVRLSQVEWLYNAGICTNQIERIWKDSDWKNSYKIDFLYVNGVFDSEVHSVYTDGSENPFKKFVCEYSGSTLTSKKEFSYTNNTWNTNLQTDYKYSPESKVDSLLISAYKSGNVVQQFRMKNFYNSVGLLSSQLETVKDPANNWVNSQLINWFYTPSSTNIMSERTKKWNSEYGLWENYQRTDYEYNSANKLISETYQYWKTMFWQSDLRYDYMYDINGNEIKKTVSQPIYNQWRSLISINYSDFNENKSNLMESKYEFWGGNTGELVTSFIPYDFNNELAIQKGKKLVISYSAVSDTITSPPSVKVHSIKIYPNPSDGIYYFNMEEYAVQSWIITDLSGRIVKSHSQSVSSGVIDITEVPKGMYVLKVMTKDGQLTQKLMKE